MITWRISAWAEINAILSGEPQSRLRDMPSEVALYSVIEFNCNIAAIENLVELNIKTVLSAFFLLYKQKKNISPTSECLPKIARCSASNRYERVMRKNNSLHI